MYGCKSIKEIDFVLVPWGRVSPGYPGANTLRGSRNQKSPLPLPSTAHPVNSLPGFPTSTLFLAPAFPYQSSHIPYSLKSTLAT
jgi:hypothetical protein